MKKKLLYIFVFFASLNIVAQENIVSFTSENGTHDLTSDKMFTHRFYMPESTDYDLRELGVNLDATTTVTNAVIRFAIYDEASQNLLWQSEDVNITGGTEEYVSVTIPANTVNLIKSKGYRVALLENPNGGSIFIDAFPDPENEGVAPYIDGANFAYYDGKTTYPNFPDTFENSGPNTISWYRAISVVVKGDAQTLSSNTYNLTDTISIYPNPTSEVIHIKLQEGITLKSVNFYNVLGQSVKSANTSSISISDLNSGTYFVEIVTNKGQMIKTVIVN